MTLDPGKCRSCGAPILWAVMVSGKRNPLDLKPMKLAPDQPEALLVQINAEGYGKTERCREGYLSHFASCPYAGAHRRRM